MFLNFLTSASEKEGEVLVLGAEDHREDLGGQNETLIATVEVIKLASSQLKREKAMDLITGAMKFNLNLNTMEIKSKRELKQWRMELMDRKLVQGKLLSIQF